MKLVSKLSILFLIGTAPLGPALAGDTVTIVPQIAAGTFDGGLNNVTTTVQIINQTSGEVQVTAEFFGSNGSVSTIPFTTTDSTTPDFTGVLGPVALPANTSLVLTSSSEIVGAVNWGRITTDAPAIVVATFEIRSSDGTLVSRVGVPGSDGDLRSVVIPRIRDPQKIATAIAVVNTADSTATITATLWADQVQVAQAEFELGAGNHTARFINELLAPLQDPEGITYSHLVLESDRAGLAGISLVFEGFNQATLPVSRPDGDPAPSGTSVGSPEGTYEGILLVGFYNCTTGEFGGVIFGGDFVITQDATGRVQGEAVFSGDGTDEEEDGPVTLNISFEADISGTGVLSDGTFTETNLIDGVQAGSGNGTVTGTIDGTTINLTLTGTDTENAPPNHTCRIVGSFSQPE